MKIAQNKRLFKPFCFSVVMAGIFLLSASAWAQPNQVSEVGRYLTVNAQPQTEQMDLLSPIVQTHFLLEIKTVGEAITDLLQYSGYSLVATEKQAEDLQETLKKPLPLVDRDLGPMPLRQALTILAGPAFDLVVDPLHRTINFQLKPAFESTKK